jgi:hypothetical protein
VENVFTLDSNEHYFRERYHIPRIPCGDHLLVCILQTHGRTRGFTYSYNAGGLVAAVQRHNLTQSTIKIKSRANSKKEVFQGSDTAVS